MGLAGIERERERERGADISSVTLINSTIFRNVGD
jgi:hypothetical protein